MPSSPNAAALEQKLFDCGALLTGHFQLSSGLHSDRYVQCAKLLQHPTQAEWAAKALAAQLDTPIDLVVGPALGGVIIAHELARALGVCAVFTERVEGQMSLRRGFEIAPGARVLVAEDVITTGGSAREAADCITALGGEVVAYACLVDRGGATAMPAPTVALMQLPFVAVKASECPACSQGSPVEKPGSRPAAMLGGSHVR